MKKAGRRLDAVETREAHIKQVAEDIAQKKAKKEKGKGKKGGGKPKKGAEQQPAGDKKAKKAKKQDNKS